MILTSSCFAEHRTIVVVPTLINPTSHPRRPRKLQRNPFPSGQIAAGQPAQVAAFHSIKRLA
jgi:hypothetical protein